MMANILIGSFTAILMVDGFMIGIQTQPGKLKNPHPIYFWFTSSSGLFPDSFRSILNRLQYIIVLVFLK